MPIGFHSAFAIALAVIAGGGTAMAAADPLTPYRWTSRLLVLSASDPADRRLAEQREAVVAARAGFGERDLVVVEAVGVDSRARDIRRRFDLPPDTFRAVLVGKDGGAKLIASEPIPASRLFSTIDAMPMRRNEMARRH